MGAALDCAWPAAWRFVADSGPVQPFRRTWLAWRRGLWRSRSPHLQKEPWMRSASWRALDSAPSHRCQAWHGHLDPIGTTWVIETDGRPARSHASQGQQRLITLGLKLAELRDCARSDGPEPILLLDDVLQRNSTKSVLGAVFSFLEGTQVKSSSPRPDPNCSIEWAWKVRERESFRLDCGRLERPFSRRADPSLKMAVLSAVRARAP